MQANESCQMKAAHQVHTKCICRQSHVLEVCHGPWSSQPLQDAAQMKQQSDVHRQVFQLGLVCRDTCSEQPSLRRIPLFTRNLLENVLLCLVASGIESSARRWLTSIELEWRDALTARIHKNYFLNMVGSFQHFPCDWDWL